MRRALSLLAVLASCAVSPAEECRSLSVASAFTDEERAALELAVARWNDVALERLCLRPDPSPTIVRVHYGGPDWQAVSAASGGTDVLGWWDGSKVFIVDALASPLFEQVAMHELGHALGLGHVPPPAIMAEGAGTADDLTPADIAECRRVGACGQ